jgi:hypothetical protein
MSKKPYSGMTYWTISGVTTLCILVSLFFADSPAMFFIALFLAILNVIAWDFWEPISKAYERRVEIFDRLKDDSSRNRIYTFIEVVGSLVFLVPVTIHIGNWILGRFESDDRTNWLGGVLYAVLTSIMLWRTRGRF